MSIIGVDPIKLRLWQKSFRVIIHQIIKKSKNSLFVRNVAVLASGTILAQLIFILASPILTRLYTPEAFGLFATFIALISSISPGVTGKFEVAMVLPKRENIAVELFGVAIWFGLIISILFLLIVLIFQEQVLLWLDAPKLKGWILLAPLVLLLTGLFNLVGLYSNRHKQYAWMARSRILRALTIVSFNIILGLFGVGFLGLLIGNIAGLVVASIYLVYKQYGLLTGFRMKWSGRKTVLVRRYWEYPVFSASTAFLSGFTSNLPIFFLMHNFPGEVAGYYALVVRVIMAPIGFIATSVALVNQRKVVDLVNAGKRIEPHIYKVTLGLLLLSLPPTVVMVFWGPSLFALVFGESWAEAGYYAQIMAVAFIFRFTVSTLTMTFGATRNQPYAAVWKVTNFISTAAVLAIVSAHGTVVETLVGLVLNWIVMYSFCYYLILRAAKNPRNY